MEPDFDEIERANLDDIIKQFHGWIDGYTHGAKLENAPYILLQAINYLHDLQKHLSTAAPQPKDAE